MSSVACIMMQKNEDLLIELWLLHHAELFGFENLYVYDNGSTSSHVVGVLRRYEVIGVKVFWDRSTPRDFDLKGWIIGDLIKELEIEKKYDFYFPLDCDEFVALAEEGGFTASRNKVLAFLRSRKGCSRVLRVSHCLMNVAGSLDVFGIVGHQKSIVPAGHFRSIDHGFHEAELESGKAFYNTPIVHIHMHNKPFAILLEHAKDKLRPYVDVDDQDALRDFNGVGAHLKKYFFDYEVAYKSSLDWAPRVRFEGLLQRAVAFRLEDFVTHWTAAREVDPVPARPNVVLEVQAELEDMALVSEGDEDTPRVIRRILDAHGRQKDPAESARRIGLRAVGDRDWAVASESWSTFRQLMPDDAEGYSMGVLAYREFAQYDKAETLATAGIQRFPQSCRLMVEWALITFPTRQWVEGRRRFDEIRVRFPDDLEGYVRGIEIALNLGDLDEAQRLRQTGSQKFGSTSPFKE